MKASLRAIVDVRTLSVFGAAMLALLALVRTFMGRDGAPAAPSDASTRPIINPATATTKGLSRTEASALWVFLAIAAAAIVAALIVFTVPAPASPLNYSDAVQYILDESLWLFVLTGAAIAFVGATMRAFAQRGDTTDKQLDYVGKLFAVGAASLAVWVGFLSIPYLFVIGWPFGSTVLVACGGVAVTVLGLLLVRRSR